MTPKTDHIFWLGHDSFRIEGSRVIYIDPWEVEGPTADIIMVTHGHYDHCDPAAVKALSGPKTKIFTDPASASKLKHEVPEATVTAMEPGDEIAVYDVVIKAVAAYNIDKKFHPKADNGLGFIITIDGQSIYHAGDTDFIPEMKGLKPQIALIPVSGTYVMTAEQAAQATLAIDPELAIPMHYGKIVGDEIMAAQYAEALKGKVPVLIKQVVK